MFEGVGVGIRWTSVAAAVASSVVACIHFNQSINQSIKKSFLKHINITYITYILYNKHNIY